MSIQQLLFGKTTPPATSASDDFNRADSASLGSDWTPISGLTGLSISTNTAYATGATQGDYWSANTFTSNQYSEAYVILGGGVFGAYGTYGGPAISISSSANTMYFAKVTASNVDASNDNVNVTFFKMVAGVETAYGSGGDITYPINELPPGITVYIQIVNGNWNISYKPIGHSDFPVSLTSGNNTDISGGQPGLYAVSSGDAFDDWYGGNA